MANVIIPKRSTVAGKVPATGDLVTGEIAINLTDKKLYSKDGSGAVIEIGGSATVDLLNVNSGISAPDYIQFDTAASNTPAIGKLYWDAGEGSFLYTLSGGNVTQNLHPGSELVYNGTGATLTKGQVVYLSGAQGQRPSVALALATSDSTSARTIGIVAETIANGAEGWIRTSGILEGFDTATFTEGAQLYLSGTVAGGMTATKPVAPTHLVYVARCIKSHATAGRILVGIQNGYELDEIHDVLITSPVGDNEVLAYNSATGLWKNETIVSALGYTPYNTSNPAGYITSSGSITGNAATASLATAATRTVIQDTRTAALSPNDYLDYHTTFEFTNQIIAGGDWHSAMTMQGWHDGYAAWQIIGPSSTSAHENFYLRSGNFTTWNAPRRIWHSGDSTISASADFRAPVFYDSNNTAFYTDPAGTSVLANLAVTGDISVGNSSGDGANSFRLDGFNSTFYIVASSGAGAGAGTTIAFRTAPAGGGELDRLFVDANGSVIANVDVRAPVFYDSNNTAYWLDPAGNSVFSAFNIGGGEVYFYGSATNAVSIRTGAGGAYKYFTFDASGNFYALNGAVYGDTFYDQANTAYYANPAGTSVFSIARASRVQFASGTTAITLDDSSYQILLDPTGRPALYLGGADPGSYYDNSTHYFRDRSGVQYATIAASGMYGARFYDFNDTGYYVDPAWESNLKQASFQDYVRITNTGGAQRLLMGNQDSGGTNSPAIITSANRAFWFGYGNSWSGSGGTNTNYSYMGSDYAQHDVSYRAPIFYDTDDTGYYLNPSSSSNIYSINVASQLVVGGDARAPIFYDSNNTGYYVDPNATSNLAGLTVANTINGSISGNADTVDGRHASYFYPNVTDNGYATGDIAGTTAHQRLWGTDSVQDMFAFNSPTEVEYSTNGVDWVSTTCPADVFDGKVYGEWGGMSMNVGNNIGGWRYVRMTWRNFGYRFFSHFTIAHSTNGHSFNFVFYKSDLSGNFGAEAFRLNGIRSWPGYTFVKHENVSGWWDTRDIRLVFELNHNADLPNNAISVGHIGLMGSYGGFNRLYDWNASKEVTFNGSVRAPIFYDSGNTGYYLNPNDISNLFTTKFNTASGGATGRTVVIKDETTSEILFGSYPGGWTSALQIQNNDNSDFVWISPLDLNNNARIRTGGCGLDFYTDGGNDTGTHSLFVGSGYAQGISSLRAPIFYDSDNTGYYVDPAGSTSLRTVGDWRSDSSAWTGEFNGKIQYHASNWYFQAAGSWEFRRSDSANAFYVSQGGVAIASSDMRAPIFYDSNNTAYFVDPASTAGNAAYFAGGIHISGANVTGNGLILADDGDIVDMNDGYCSMRFSNGIRIRNGNRTGDPAYELNSVYGASSLENQRGFVINGNYTDGRYSTRLRKWDDGGGVPLYIQQTTGTAGSWSNVASFGSSNSRYTFHVDGIMYTAFDVRASQFVDANDTGYYVDPNSSSNFNTTYANEYYSRGWFRNNNSGNGIYNQATGQHFYSDGGNGWNIAGGGSNNWLRFCDTHAGTVRGYVYADNGNNIGFLNQNGSWSLQCATGGNITATGDFRAPIFYDSNNTGYYVDPASTSNLGSVTVNGYLGGTIVTGYYIAPSGGVDASLGYAALVTFDGYGTTVPGFSPASWNVNLLSIGNSTRGYQIGAGYEQSYPQFRNGNSGWSSWKSMLVEGTWINSKYFDTNGAIYGTIFYDSNDTGYYLDPNGTSNLYRTSTYLAGKYVSGDWADGFRNTPTQSYNFHGDVSSGGPSGTWWFYESMRHSNSANYWGTQIAWGWEDNANRLMQRNVTSNSFSGWVEYLNTSDRTFSGNLYMTGSIRSTASDIRAPIFYDQNDTTYYANPNSESVLNTLTLFGELNLSAGTNYVDHSGTITFRNQGNYVNSATLTTGGDFTASGNVTAYSDISLKKNIELITNPIEKINSINGVTFERIDTGVKGTGVIAQEIEKVLPEVVIEDENGIKSVAYGNIVGLLIEAIKEQQSQINALESKMEEILAKLK